LEVSMRYERSLNTIDEQKELFCGVSDAIWDNPETSFGEYYAAELLMRVLEENGFCVTRGHSWQSTSQCRGSYAKRAMLYAGKAVAGTLIRLFEDPSLIERAKAEHREKIGDGYVCGLPDGLEPEIQPRPTDEK